METFEEEDQGEETEEEETEDRTQYNKQSTQENAEKLVKSDGWRKPCDALRGLLELNEEVGDLVAGKTSSHVYYAFIHAITFVVISSRMGISACVFLARSNDTREETVKQRREGVVRVYELLIRLHEMFGVGTPVNFKVGVSTEIRAKFVDGAHLAKWRKPVNGGEKEAGEVNKKEEVGNTDSKKEEREKDGRSRTQKERNKQGKSVVKVKNKQKEEAGAVKIQLASKNSKTGPCSYYEVAARKDKEGDSYCEKLALENKQSKDRTEALNRIRNEDVECPEDTFSTWLDRYLTIKTAEEWQPFHKENNHVFVHKHFVTALINLELIYEHLFVQCCHNCFCCVTNGSSNVTKFRDLLRYVVQTASQKRTAFSIEDNALYETNAIGNMAIQKNRFQQARDKLTAPRCPYEFDVYRKRLNEEFRKTVVPSLETKKRRHKPGKAGTADETKEVEEEKESASKKRKSPPDTQRSKRAETPEDDGDRNGNRSGNSSSAAAAQSSQEATKQREIEIESKRTAKPKSKRSEASNEKKAEHAEEEKEEIEADDEKVVEKKGKQNYAPRTSQSSYQASSNLASGSHATAEWDQFVEKLKEFVTTIHGSFIRLTETLSEDGEKLHMMIEKYQNKCNELIAKYEPSLRSGGAPPNAQWIIKQTEELIDAILRETDLLQNGNSTIKKGEIDNEATELFKKIFEFQLKN